MNSVHNPPYQAGLEARFAIAARRTAIIDHAEGGSEAPASTGTTDTKAAAA